MVAFTRGQARTARRSSIAVVAVAFAVSIASGSAGHALPSLQGLLKVGYLGCSQTTGAVQGYHELGGMRMWETIEYGGGAVSRWANPATSSQYWALFDEAYRAHPSLTIWWQLCIIAGDVNANLSDAHLVLSQLHVHAPASVIYVSAQNGYVAPHICGIGPPNGPAIAQQVADDLVATTGVLRGPHMSDLRGSDSAGVGPTETDSGGCHPNEIGRAKLGANLLTFFG